MMNVSPDLDSMLQYENSGEDVDPTEKLPLVSIVIPCRNEEKFIARCLDSLLKNDYPQDRLEILAVDGRSEDNTREIITEYSRRFSFIRLIDNPNRSIPSAMNRSLEKASGEIIVKIDAHSIYHSNHISDCVKYQREWGAENVGGVLEITPSASTDLARTIVVALSSRFGSGSALIKTKVNKPTWSDAVAFGCYRKSFLQTLGGFNENLTGSSDMDLNRRIQSAGGRILLVPQIVVQYFADSNLKALCRHNFADGVWATYVLKFKSRAWSWRHWVPLAFILGLLITLIFGFLWSAAWWLSLVITGTYLIVNFAESIRLAIRERNGKMVILLPLVFAIRHLSHGFGALYGAALVPIPGIHWKGRRSSRG